MIHKSRRGRSHLFNGKESFPRTLGNFMRIPIPGEEKPIAREVDCFVRYAAGEEVPPIHKVDVYEGARSVAVCVAALESLKLKKPVSPEKFE